MLAPDFGVRAPATHLLRSPEDVAAIASESRRLVVKPVYSRFASFTLVRPAADVLLRSVFPTAQTAWVAQDFVEGEERCSWTAFDAGRVAAHVCYRPVRRVGTGAGTLFESIEDAAVLRFVEAIGGALNLTGQAGFDYFAAGNGLHVLECNPRSTSGVHFFSDAPGVLALCLLPGEILQRVVVPAGRRFMVAGAVLPEILALRQGAIADFISSRDVVWRRDDPLPALAQLAVLATLGVRSLVLRKSLRQASTADIEWNGNP